MCDFAPRCAISHVFNKLSKLQYVEFMIFNIWHGFCSIVIKNKNKK